MRSERGPEGDGAAEASESCGYRTMIQALDAAPEDADTLIVDYFPDLLEHMELMTRIPDAEAQAHHLPQGLADPRVLPFQQRARPARHLRCDRNPGTTGTTRSARTSTCTSTRRTTGSSCARSWRRKFQETTILAFYGSAVGLDKADTDRVSGLVEKLAVVHRPERRAC